MNSPGFLILIIAFGFLWFFLIRPQKRRQVEAARMLNSIDVGDEVLTAGGIYGEVTELHDTDVMVRIAPDLEVRVARKAIGGVTRKSGEADVTDETADEAQEHDSQDEGAEPEAPPTPEHDG